MPSTCSQPGSARVVKQGDHGEEVPLNVLRRGDSFGEMALLAETVRLATVRASSAVQALRLGKSVFAALTRSHPQVREAFQALANGRSLWNFFRVHSGFSQLSNEALGAARLGARASRRPGRRDRRSRGRSARADVRDRAGSRARLQARRRRREPPRVPAHGRLLRRAVAVSERAARRERAGRLRLHAPALPARALPPPARRAPRLPAPARAAHPAVRLPPRRQRPARLRRGDPARGGVACNRSPPSRSSSSPSSKRRRWTTRTAAAKQRPIRKFPHVYQLDEMDCGAACLAMICRHFGRAVGISHIREVVHTSTDGTTLAGITRGAEELGLVGALGPRVEEPARRAAAPGGRALGGKPLGRRLPRRRQARARRRPGAAGSAGSRARSSWSAGAATPRSSATRSAWPTRRRHGRASPGSSRSCARTCGWCCSRSCSRSRRRRSSSSCRS